MYDLKEKKDTEKGTQKDTQKLTKKDTMNNAVDYVNFYYYSKAMSVINIGSLQIPFITPLHKLRTSNGYQFMIRCSHGLLHALQVMELIQPIHELYKKIPGSNYNHALKNLCNEFKIEIEDLIFYVELAALFHDSGRKGDGKDLWDEDSANNCHKYLLSTLGNHQEKLITLISDTIRYKDSPEAFGNKHKNPDYDYLRQLVNMADCMEVMRTRKTFDLEKLPIASLAQDEFKRNELLQFITEHRRIIAEQGRLKLPANIRCQSHKDINPYANNYGSCDKRMADHYLQQCKKYPTIALLEIGVSEESKQNAVNKALRGIDSYLDENKKPHLQFFHNGAFWPLYHGTSADRRRAYYYKNLLSRKNASLDEKLGALYAMLTNEHKKLNVLSRLGLQNAVLRSFNQMNLTTLLEELKKVIPAAAINHSQQHIENATNWSHQLAALFTIPVHQSGINTKLTALIRLNAILGKNEHYQRWFDEKPLQPPHPNKPIGSFFKESLIPLFKEHEGDIDRLMKSMLFKRNLAYAVSAVILFATLNTLVMLATCVTAAPIFLSASIGIIGSLLAIAAFCKGRSLNINAFEIKSSKEVLCPRPQSPSP